MSKYQSIEWKSLEMGLSCGPWLGGPKFHITKKIN
uniref:Uncharacterized protein n=1 Tax=Rhizophora mucronata TaxID=61149 RepID=A0A2P2PNN5_RHIMU